jgi:hypothetical protein
MAPSYLILHFPEAVLLVSGKFCVLCKTLSKLESLDEAAIAASLQNLHGKNFVPFEILTFSRSCLRSCLCSELLLLPGKFCILCKTR